MEAAKPQLILDRCITLIVGGITSIKRNFHEAASLFWKVIPCSTQPFGFDKFSRGLSRKKTHQSDKTCICLRGAWVTGLGCCADNQAVLLRLAPSWLCHVDAFSARPQSNVDSCID